MGNSASSAEKSHANERRAVRSLGDRYPLGDAELRKWCWMYGRLSSASPPPVAIQPQSPSLLSLLTVWSALYGDYNPYSRRSQSQSHLQTNTPKNPIISRSDSANKAVEAISNVEQHILPVDLSAIIAQHALGLSLKGKAHSTKQTVTNDPIQSAKSLTNSEEILAFQESYYSIASTINQYLPS
eukprot:CAMPEP_0172555894 /NCGR_PEP_ID=MMETSP1067-20121228/61307_1 /TAXON_ID=265564 ORGANISM="Thalassiosira punctigera, Strain Tpunct2005C2" /NCGR_SAMPLE_ID=MMETSP1067 /ASSEMBLY_ACC=CAM_ASM_000444 /LENGTH=183 /DNA_ID=CAMNT_0013344521 /DNA_START=108 /DNA_END=655 /DNA_ORIENTATION=-